VRETVRVGVGDRVGIETVAEKSVAPDAQPVGLTA
jgi:hypothetical protein